LNLKSVALALASDVDKLLLNGKHEDIT